VTTKEGRTTVIVIEVEQTENGKTIRNDRLIGASIERAGFRSLTSLKQRDHRLISWNELSGKAFRV
jgi:hypothetical protein